MRFASLYPSYQLVDFVVACSPMRAFLADIFDPSGNTPALVQNPVNPLRQKYILLYRNSELRYPFAIPVQGEGRSYVVTNVGRGAVGAAAAGTRRRDQGGVNLVRSLLRATDGAEAYGKTMSSWLSLLQPSFREDASANRTRCITFR